MAYMHELVHVCHPCCPFFGTSTISNSYYGNFVIGATGIAPVIEKRLNILYENCPVKKEKERKIFYEKIIFMIKFIGKIFWIDFYFWRSKKFLGIRLRL